VRSYSSCPDILYQLMSHFISKIMAGADFMLADVMYSENSVLPYLFNAKTFVTGFAIRGFPHYQLQ